jgi:hypothetical protein
VPQGRLEGRTGFQSLREYPDLYPPTQDYVLG